MSDLNTALRTALDGWDSDDKETTTQSTTMTNLNPSSMSITEQAFEYIKANPGTTTKAAVNALTKRNLNPTSTKSIISQMVRTSVLRRDGHALYPMINQYRPLGLKKKKPQAVSIMLTHKPAAAQRHPANTGGIVTLTNPQAAGNIAVLIDNISVKEARDLYIELKRMFGSN